MYICICKQVTDSSIKKAIDSGANTLKKLSCALEIGRQCGKCCPHVKDILNSALESQQNTQQNNTIVAQNLPIPIHTRR